jgi:hypothetical protein
LKWGELHNHNTIAGWFLIFLMENPEEEWRIWGVSHGIGNPRNGSMMVSGKPPIDGA